MCFVWISEQTAIISLYNINWLVLVMWKWRVFCEVGTTILNVSYVAVWPLTESWLRRSADGFHLRSVQVGFVMYQVALGQGSSRSTSVSSVSIVPPTLYSPFHLNAAIVRRTSGRSLWAFIAQQWSFRYRQYWTEKWVHVFVVWR